MGYQSLPAGEGKMARVIRSTPQKIALTTIDSEKENPNDQLTENKRLDDAVDRYRKKATTPLKAIRALCVECMGGYVKWVADCETTTCPLHPFRMGVNGLLKKRREDETDD